MCLEVGKLELSPVFCSGFRVSNTNLCCRRLRWLHSKFQLQAFIAHCAISLPRESCPLLTAYTKKFTGLSILDPLGFLSGNRQWFSFRKCDIGLLELAEFTSFYLAIGAIERARWLVISSRIKDRVISSKTDYYFLLRYVGEAGKNLQRSRREKRK